MFEYPPYLHIQVVRIKDFEDVTKLAKADQYFSQVKFISPFLAKPLADSSLEIVTIPRLPERIECMLYRRKLDLDIAEIRPELNILRNATLELRTSKKFKQILQVT